MVVVGGRAVSAYSRAHLDRTRTAQDKRTENSCNSSDCHVHREVQYYIQQQGDLRNPRVIWREGNNIIMEAQYVNMTFA